MPRTFGSDSARRRSWGWRPHGNAPQRVMGATLSARGLRVGTTRRTHDRHVVTHRVTPLSQESTLTATLRLVPPRRGPRLRLASCGCLWRCVPRTQNQRSIRDRPQLLRLSAALLVGARPRFKLGPLEAERLARTNQYPYSEPAIPLGCFSDSFPIGLWVLRSAESQLRQLPGSTRASSFRLRFKLGPRAMHFDFCFIAAPFAESPLTQLWETRMRRSIADNPGTKKATSPPANRSFVDVPRQKLL